MNKLRVQLSVLLILVSVFGATACRISDERVLRNEFDIPVTAELVEITSSPETPGWFGREGLKISATFQFSHSDFQDYMKRAEEEETWVPLPPSREFIYKITGIRSYLEALRRTEEILAEQLPEGGGQTFPAEEELYKNWMEQLPLDNECGMYQCKTAGDDLLNAVKVPCKERAGDLDDFMLAVLDEEGRKLRVFVHTSY